MKKTLLLAACAVFAIGLNAKDLAVYNGKTITEKDIDPIILPTGQAISILNLNKQDQEKAIADFLFAQEVLKEAKTKKFDQQKEFKEALQKQSDELLLRYYTQKSMEAQKVSDKEIKDFYDANKSLFLVKGQNQVAHILVKTEKEANEIIKQLKDLKDDALAKKFIELAKTKSIEPAAKQTGGVLPAFDKEGTMQNGGKLVPEFVSGAVKLKVGEVSKAVKTEFGYHVILKINESKDQTISLEDAKDNIAFQLKMDKYKKSLQQQQENFMKKSKIEFK